ncbi:MAG: hypothetical protein WC393_01760 [Candidatus Nanoarchaeia archaeon]|jgi:ABC-type uncharacterized transport system permease subunit
MSYFYVVKKTFESKIFYFKEMFLDNISLVFSGLFAIFIGIYLNNVNPVFSSLNELLIYYFFGNGILNLFQRGNVVREIERDVINGNLNVHFVKPYDFIVFKLVKYYTHKLFKVIINISIFFILINMFQATFMPLDMVLRAILIIPAAIIFMILNTSVFCFLSLMIEKIGRLHQTYGMLGYFIGGGLVSAKYFPNFIKFLPQYFYFGAPLEYILNGVFENFGLFIIYTIILIVLNLVVRKIVYSRLETNG